MTEYQYDNGDNKSRCNDQQSETNDEWESLCFGPAKGADGHRVLAERALLDHKVDGQRWEGNHGEEPHQANENNGEGGRDAVLNAMHDARVAVDADETQSPDGHEAAHKAVRMRMRTVSVWLDMHEYRRISELPRPESLQLRERLKSWSWQTACRSQWAICMFKIRNSDHILSQQYTCNKFANYNFWEEGAKSLIATFQELE